MKCLTSALAFASASVVTAILLGFLFSGLNAAIVRSAIACGILVAGAAWWTTNPQPPARLGLWDWLALTVFALASLRAFLWVIYSRGDEICVLSPNNLGDLSLHLNLIRYLASGVALWPESSILSRVPLSYPLGADLFNSLLEVCGIDTIRGLVWTGLFGAALTGYALWSWGGAFGVAAFLFNGGLAGFALLRTLQIEDFQRDLVWKNLFLAMFVTQRGLLFALPSGLLLLSVWRERYFRGSSRIIPFWLQLLLYAGMPLFNIHAFLFLSLVLLGIFLASFFDAKTPDEQSAPSTGASESVARPARPGPFFRGGTFPRREVLALVASAAVPATFALFLVTGFFSVSSGMRWSPGWIPGEAGGSLWVWIWNFGLALPLSLGLAVALAFDKDLEARCFVWTAGAVFAACCVFVFAPWEWDNMKLMIWSWLVVAPYLWRKLLAPLKLPARAAVCIVLFFSGGASLIGGLDGRHGYAIARRSEMAAWQHAIAGIPPDVRFACVSEYNHPLILLGRKVACGYEGHLWSHGLDYKTKLALLNKSLSGEASWISSQSSLDVKWLALRNKDLPAARPPGDPPAVEAYGALYDLTPLLKQDPSSPESPLLRPRSVDLSW
ncbi:MAG: hypothetical protein WBX20_17450 [Terrimicrobiaceae bacterium]